MTIVLQQIFKVILFSFLDKAVRFMKDQFGEDWFEPRQLFVRPQFIFEKFNISEKCRADVKIQQRFFAAVRSLKDKKELHGYFLLNCDFSPIESDDPLEIQVVFISKDVIKVIELASEDTEENVKNLERQLDDRIEAINIQIDNQSHKKIPVEGMIIFPCKGRPDSCAENVYTVLYQNELMTELKMKLITPQQFLERTSQVMADVKITIARLISFNMLKWHYAKSEEEAIYEVAIWLCGHSDDKNITVFTRMPFNSIKLTEPQKILVSDLTDMNEHGCTILSGPYGIGKSVVIVRAIKELFESNSNLKVLFMSAQSFLSDAELKFSPFLTMIEDWIAGLYEPNSEKYVKVRRHTDQRKLEIEYLATEAKSSDKRVTFSSYLLKHTDLEALHNAKLTLEMFDIIVLEETNAIDLSEIKN